jgi:hypothetical protein
MHPPSLLTILYISTQVLQPQDATTEDTATASERDKEFKRIADELCPLVDRFGRVLTDLSPLLRALGSTTAPALSPIGNGITTWGAQNPLSPDYFPAPEHPSNNMLEMSLASLLRPRYYTNSLFRISNTIPHII